MMTKLPAFTLIEVIVAMIIGSLVISFSYKGFSLMNENFTRYAELHRSIMDDYRLEALMEHDFGGARLIETEDQGFLFTEVGVKITYRFLKTQVVRSQQPISDTFNVAARGIKTHTCSHEGGSKRTIDELSFFALKEEDTLHFNFHKEYASDILIQNDSLEFLKDDQWR